MTLSKGKGNQPSCASRNFELVDIAIAEQTEELPEFVTYFVDSMIKILLHSKPTETEINDGPSE